MVKYHSNTIGENDKKYHFMLTCGVAIWRAIPYSIVVTGQYQY